MSDSAASEEAENVTIQRTIRQAIEQLNGAFKISPFRFYREAELHSHLYHLLVGDPMVACDSKWGSCPLIHQEYPTPFKCSMAGGHFEVANDSSLSRRAHYDLVVLNPWWIDNPWWTDKASPEGLMGANFQLFCEEIRNKALERHPPFCLVGIEMHLVRSERPTKADYDLILQDCRKLLSSGGLQNGWRFMDHRYMLVYSHYSQPHEAKWRELKEVNREQAADAESIWIAWTSPQGTRWSG